MSIGTTGALIAAAVGAAGSIGSALIGSHAASSAAAQQEAAQQKVINLTNADIPIAQSDIQNGEGAANSTLGQFWGGDVAALQPYEAAGSGALTQLEGITGAGGFKAPTAAEAAATPGYQFQLQQGEQAQAQAAAASGQALGGGELKAADQYAQGLASTNYNNTYNQSLSTYNENLGALQALANMGQTATNTQVSAGDTLGSEMASNAFQGGALQSQNVLTGLGIETGALTNQGNAAAAGTVGSANAWSNGISGAANSITSAYNNNNQMQLLNKILSSGGTTV